VILKKLIKNYLPFLILSFLTIYFSFNYLEKRYYGVIFSDSEGYYMYLPAIFIYDGFENVPVQTKQQYEAYPGTEKIFTKYTYGVALLQLPFFLTAHILAPKFNYPQDGFSIPYRIGIMMAAAFYLLFGLLLLFRILRRTYSYLTSTAVVLMLFAGTNLYYYTIGAPGSAHVFTFFLISLFIYYTPVFLNSNKWKHLFLYTLLFVFITLSRPTNILIILYPLMYNITSWTSLRDRMKKYIFNAKNLLVIIAAIFIVLLPQSIYWFYISGKWLMYSYTGEGFIYWKDPKIGKVLFGVWNGWFIYTPLALFFVFGLLLMWRKNVQNARPILIILVIATFLFASWWTWWFGGCFGHRCYVDFYGFMIFPLAFIFDNIIRKKNLVLKYGTLLIMAFFVYLNLYFTYAYEAPWDGLKWTWEDYRELYINMLSNS